MLYIFQEQANAKLKQVRLYGKALKEKKNENTRNNTIESTIEEANARERKSKRKKYVMINMNIYLNIVEG